MQPDEPLNLRIQRPAPRISLQFTPRPQHQHIMLSIQRRDTRPPTQPIRQTRPTRRIPTLCSSCRQCM